MKILLGVTGSIAAYKAAELVRILQTRGVDVQVALTSAAEEFVRPLTFAALTGHPVLGSLWQPAPHPSSRQFEDPFGGYFEIEHIAIAQQIDALLIAPASANTLARLAHGFADDLLSAVYLATRAPVILAPAMNVNMWSHPATQANLARLTARGASLVPPGAGYLACGMTGGGRLADLQTIADATLAAGSPSHPPRDLASETILITAGGTREAIDAVRFLGNRSSGKMGYALAAEALARGARVLLITASALAAPATAAAPAAAAASPGAETIRVTSAEDMLAAVLAHLPVATMVIKAAAVADFRPTHIAPGKLRRGGSLTLELEPTPDILAAVVAHRTPGMLVIGFAAETGNILPNGRAKLARKHLDALVVNDISHPGTGFDADENSGWFLTPDAALELPLGSKRHMAARILDHALALRAHSLLPV